MSRAVWLKGCTFILFLSRFVIRGVSELLMQEWRERGWESSPSQQLPNGAVRTSSPYFCVQQCRWMSVRQKMKDCLHFQSFIFCRLPSAIDTRHYRKNWKGRHQYTLFFAVDTFIIDVPLSRLGNRRTTPTKSALNHIHASSLEANPLFGTERVRDSKKGLDKFKNQS